MGLNLSLRVIYAAGEFFPYEEAFIGLRKLDTWYPLMWVVSMGLPVSADIVPSPTSTI